MSKIPCVNKFDLEETGQVTINKKTDLAAVAAAVP
jgi:hypothetical protein